MRALRNNYGFTLVEILVVMVIMGLVITSVYSLFINTQRTANTSEEVVDVQQNLRVALETMAADIRMAGFLVPAGTEAIRLAPATLPNSNTYNVAVGNSSLQLHTVSSAKTYARVVSVDPDDPQRINIPTQMLRNFRDGDRVDIVSHTSGTDLRASGVTVLIDEDKDQYIITGDISRVGPRDIIVRKFAGEGDTDIRYWLRSGQGQGTNNVQLMRRDSTGGEGSVVASNLAFDTDDLTVPISFVYLDRNSDPIDDPTLNRDQIRSVRIIITGETDNTRTGLERYSGVKRRTIETTVALRNSF